MCETKCGFRANGRGLLVLCPGGCPYATPGSPIWVPKRIISRLGALSRLAFAGQPGIANLPIGPL